MFDPTLFDAERLTPSASAVLEAVVGISREPRPALADEDTLNEAKALAFAHKAYEAMLGERLLEVAERELTVLEGRQSIGSWAAAELLMPPAQASALVRAARAARKLPKLRELYMSGRLSTRHILLAAAAMDGFPEDKIEPADTFLAEEGRSRPTDEFAAICRELRETVVPELVADELDRLPESSTFTCSSVPGGVRVTGTIYGADAEAVRVAIDRMSPPLPDDYRGAAKRRADGLATMCRITAGADLTAGDLQGTGYTPADLPKVGIEIITDLISLQRAFDREAVELAARFNDPVDRALLPGWMPASESELIRGTSGERSGAAIGWRELVKHFCDAGIQRLVLGPDSEPLDLGREVRLFSRAQRRAMGRGRGVCEWPRCTSPWVEADHQIRFVDGGPTDVCNGKLYCAFHHGLRHRGWKVAPHVITGEIVAIPPADWAYQLAKSRRRVRPRVA